MAVNISIAKPGDIKELARIKARALQPDLLQSVTLLRTERPADESYEFELGMCELGIWDVFQNRPDRTHIFRAVHKESRKIVGFAVISFSTGDLPEYVEPSLTTEGINNPLVEICHRHSRTSHR